MLEELRPRGSEGQGRSLYCSQVARRVVILHAFIKKTQSTPMRDLALARRRLKEVHDG